MRPHTMFIQAQCLAWANSASSNSLEGTQSKWLSEDPETGARTGLVQYPAGFSNRDFSLPNEEELLVLSGELLVDGVAYGPYGFAYRPANRSDSRTSARGAVVLTLLGPEGAVSAEEGPISKPTIAEQGLEAWTENPYTRYLMGTGVHPLRENPTTGEISILYSALPFRYMSKRWSHTHVQEMYVLAGEYAINDVGVMRPGAYAWWRERVFHGPYGSRTGFMMFIRSVGGPLENIIETDEIAVDYQAPYDPVLPEGLRALARPSSPQENF